VISAKDRFEITSPRSKSTLSAFSEVIRPRRTDWPVAISKIFSDASAEHADE